MNTRPKSTSSHALPAVIALMTRRPALAIQRWHTNKNSSVITPLSFYPGATPACTRARPTAARRSAATPTSCAPRRSSS